MVGGAGVVVIPPALRPAAHPPPGSPAARLTRRAHPPSSPA